MTNTEILLDILCEALVTKTGETYRLIVADHWHMPQPERLAVFDVVSDRSNPMNTERFLEGPLGPGVNGFIRMTDREL